jgi:hypothetical protein
MNSKKLLTIGVVALIAALAVAGASAAWLTSTASADNSMTPATVEIEIIESDFSPPDEIRANEPITKKVAVRNKDSETGKPRTYAYIRVAIVPVWRNADGSGTGLPTDNVQLKVLHGDGYRWFEHGGYYYYKDPVEPGATTELLLESYKVTSLPEEYKGKKLEITILASAIQAIGNAKENWPAEAVAKLNPMPDSDANP